MLVSGTAQPRRCLQCSAVEHTWFYFCEQP